jgi:hypothetical protein
MSTGVFTNRYRKGSRLVPDKTAGRTTGRALADNAEHSVCFLEIRRTNRRKES